MRKSRRLLKAGGRSVTRSASTARLGSLARSGLVVRTGLGIYPHPDVRLAMSARTNVSARTNTIASPLLSGRLNAAACLSTTATTHLVAIARPNASARVILTGIANPSTIARMPLAGSENRAASGRMPLTGIANPATCLITVANGRVLLTGITDSTARPNLTTSADPTARPNAATCLNTTVRRTPFPCGGREENSPTISYWKRKVCLPAVAEIYMQMLTGLCARHSEQPLLRRHHPKAGGKPGLMRRLRKRQPETRHLKLCRLMPRQSPGKPDRLAPTRRWAQPCRMPSSAPGLMRRLTRLRPIRNREHHCVSLACAPRLPNLVCLPGLGESGGFRVAI